MINSKDKQILRIMIERITGGLVGPFKTMGTEPGFVKRNVVRKEEEFFIAGIDSKPVLDFKMTNRALIEAFVTVLNKIFCYQVNDETTELDDVSDVNTIRLLVERIINNGLVGPLEVDQPSRSLIGKILSGNKPIFVIVGLDNKNRLSIEFDQHDIAVSVKEILNRIFCYELEVEQYNRK